MKYIISANWCILHWSYKSNLSMVDQLL